MRMSCPCCGLRDLGEFTYGGEASRVRPKLDEASLDVWSDYVFLRDNPRGAHLEYWQHTLGCRSWLVVARDTLTHEIGETRLAREVTREGGVAMARAGAKAP